PRIFFTVVPPCLRRPCRRASGSESRVLLRHERRREIASRAETCLARRCLLRRLWGPAHPFGLLLRRGDHRPAPRLQSPDLQRGRGGELAISSGGIPGDLPGLGHGVAVADERGDHVALPLLIASLAVAGRRGRSGLLGLLRLSLALLVHFGARELEEHPDVVP